MSRILVVTSGALFVHGGHIVIAEETAAALRRAGHQAEVLVTPQNRFGRQASAYAATWLTDVGETADGHRIDQVISLRFPSYAVRHPRHVCWLNHRMREYYDLWPRFSKGMGWRGLLKEKARRAIFHAIDRWLLTRHVTKLYAQSRTIQERLLRFGNISSTVLHPPAPARPYRCDGYEPFVFAVSRLHPLKRMHLLVEGLSHAPGLQAVIAGRGEEEAALRALVSARGLGGRVTLVGAIDDNAKIDYLARCAAVFFAPESEDYGFVTLEAMNSGKAVVTATDSGGPAEIVEDGKNGLLVAPEGQAVGAALKRLAENPRLAQDLGAGALVTARGHTWERAISRLLL
jgi:glycosyltransferase involved in cell wall biosynthesis